MRIVTWNMRRAKASSPAWHVIRREAPDLALLQEVSGLPDWVRRDYHCVEDQCVRKNGVAQRFGTAIITKGEIGPPVPFASPAPWVEAERRFLSGNLLARIVALPGGLRANVVSVLSPAWPLDRERLKGIDVTSIKLVHNRELWATEILWAVLRSTMATADATWIVGGDFNSSETFDVRFGGRVLKKPRGNREFMDRMAALGFTECLRGHHGKLVPTFRHSTGTVEHQLDHLYVTAPLTARLVHCDVDGQVFADRVSDHLPIVAKFV